MFDQGFLKIGSVNGVPIRVHWTMPLGALIFGHFAFVPAFWLAFFVLILVHELGHAFFVKRLGHRPLGIELTGFGGLCRWSGYADRAERATIAWGGVVAQLMLFIVTLLVLFVVGDVRGSFAAQLIGAFTSTNLLLIVINLLPFRPLDGAEAWQIVPALREPGAAARLSRRLFRIPSSGAAPRVAIPRPTARSAWQWPWKKRPRPVAVPRSEPPAAPIPSESAKKLADEFIRIAQEGSRGRKPTDRAN